VAMNAGKILQGKRQIKQVQEGQETDAFWKAIGGKTEYASNATLSEGAKEPRLFQCTTAKTGAFNISEVFNFGQDDLCNDDIYILDAFEEVFVWIGHDSSKEEKDASMKTALEFVSTAPDGRSKDTCVYKVTAGSEPPNFTCHFLGWDFSKATDFSDPYAKSLQALGSAKGMAPNAAAAGGGGGAPPAMNRAPSVKVQASDIGYKDWRTTSYSLAELQKGCPSGCDPQRREYYLSDDEFNKVFKMDKATWEGHPKWKKDQARKANKLF